MATIIDLEASIEGVRAELAEKDAEVVKLRAELAERQAASRQTHERFSQSDTPGPKWLK